jgi:hypothetical protein
MRPIKTMVEVVGVVTLFAVQLMAQSGQTVSIAAHRGTKKVSVGQRLDALARAQVWKPPAVPVSKARLAPEPGQPPVIECKFKITELGGTASKFDCVLDTGEQIRVKYGRTLEIPSEVAATRLLRSLGFGADSVTLVERVRCHGCPSAPFMTMKAVDLTQTETVFKKLVDYGDHKDFEWVAVEQKHHGRAIETDSAEGWAFFELIGVDAGKGGAPRAHVDALRLMAVFLAHWDNKSENQRLVCVDSDSPDDGTCQKPFAMLQDVGAAFGPTRVDLKRWEQAPIWVNRGTCTVSMETLPDRGGTFAPVTITDAGRRLLASLLGQLRDQQLTDLFTWARFHRLKPFIPSRQHTVAEWVGVFKRKVREISEGPACPQ